MQDDPIPGLTAVALAALLRAYDEARQREHATVEPEHVLLGLLASLDTEWLARPAQPDEVPGGEPTLGPRVTAALRRAAAAARRDRAARIGIEHILIGLATDWAEPATANPKRPDVSSPSELRLAAAVAALAVPVDRMRARRARRSWTNQEAAWTGIPPDFGESAHALLGLASIEAARDDVAFVGTRHLLVAMMEQVDTVPARVLAYVAPNSRFLRRACTLIWGRGDHPEPGPREPSLLVRGVIAAAPLEAERLGSPRVEPVHLLLALLADERGTACGLLEVMGFPLERVRALVRRELAVNQLDPEE